MNECVWDELQKGKVLQAKTTKVIPHYSHIQHYNSSFVSLNVPETLIDACSADLRYPCYLGNQVL